jgi:hypothetical protein
MPRKSPSSDCARIVSFSPAHEEKAALIFKWVAPTGAPQRPELTKIWDIELGSKYRVQVPKFFSEDEGAGR